MTTDANILQLQQKYANAPVTGSAPQTPPPGTPPPAPAPTETESLAKRSLRRAGQEVISAGGAVQGLYGLAGAAWDAATDSDVSFQDALFSDEGREVAKKAVAGDPLSILRLKHNPNSLLRTGLSQAADIYDWGGEMTGVTNNPDGSVPLDEEAGGIALSTLLTLPVAPAKLVQVPVKGAIMGAKGAAIAAKAALTAAEVATPVTFGGVKSVIANAVVQEGINDAVRYAMNEPTLTQETLGQEDYYEYGSVTPTDGLPDEGSGVEDAAIIGGTGVAAAAMLNPGRAAKALGRGLGNVATRGAAPSSMPHPRDVTLGELPGGSFMEGLRTVKNVAIDESEQLVDAVRRTQGKQAAETFADTLRANTGQSVQAAFSRFHNVGILDSDGSTRTIPMRALKKMYRSLGDRRDTFDDAMIALDEMEIRKRGLKGTMPHIETSVLQKKVDRAVKDPEILQMMEAYDRVMRSFSEVRWKKKIIGDDQFARETSRAFNAKTRSGGYVPIMEYDKGDDIVTKTRNFLTAGSRRGRATGVVGYEQMRKTSEEGGKFTRVKPIQALEEYAPIQLSEIGNTIARRAFLRQVVNAPVQAFKDGRTIARRGSRGKGTTITVRENGVDQTYTVGDPRIATALQFRPAASIPALSTMRRLFQQGTTGMLNPLFAPVSLAYDAMFGMLTARNEKLVTGILDQGLDAGMRRAMARMGYTGPKAERAILRTRKLLSGFTRPTEMPITILEGLIRGVTGRGKMMIAQHMMQRAAQNGTPVAAGRAKKAADWWMKSKYGTMHMSGYAANNYLDDAVSVDAGLSKQLAGGFKDTFGVQIYQHLTETVRDAYRTGMYARNVAAMKAAKGGKLTEADYNRIGRYTKEVASDPTRRGGAQWINGIASTMPYANVMMHSAAHLAASLNNPATWSVVLTMSAFKMWMEDSMSPEAQEYLETQVPDYKRLTYMPFEQSHEGEPFDPVKHIEWIPVGPEMGSILAMTNELAKGMFEQTETDNMAPGFVPQAKAALYSLFSLSVPPAIQVATSMITGTTIDGSGALDNREFLRQARERGGMPEMRGTNLNAGVITDQVYNIFNSALGTAGRTIMDAAEAMDSSMNRYDASFKEGLDKAIDVVMYDAVHRQAVGTLFSDFVTKQPVGTSIGNRAFELDEAMERIADMRRQIQPLTSSPRDADLPLSDFVQNLPRTLRDTPMAHEADLVRTYLLSRQHAKQFEEVSQLTVRYRDIEGDMSLPVSQKNTQLNRINQQKQDILKNIVAKYGDFEQMMIESTGNPDWSLNDFISRAEEYLLR